MQSIQTNHMTDSRLRFVFNHSVMSLNLASDATFGEVAQTLGELSNRRYGHPVAIDVRLKRRDGQLPFGQA